MTKTVVIYHYYEKDSSYRDNLLHFLSFGYSKSIDYLIVIAGKHSINLPTAENISYIFTENLNNDFGGYCHAINNVLKTSKYDFFFFINSSVRGPFLTARDKKEWTEYFIEQLQLDTGIVGSTINILSPSSPCAIGYAEKYSHSINYSHVQTTSYLLPKKTLLHLMKEGFYNSTGILDKENAIRDYEVRLSQLIKDQGWNLRSLLPEYNNLDYRIAHEDINPTSDHGDPCFKDSYFGRTAHPNEIIFIKTNRAIYPVAYFDRLAYSLFSLSSQKDQLLNTGDLDEYRARVNLVRFSKEHLSHVPLAKAYTSLIKQASRHIRGRGPKK
jgi:hypothetical protein